MSTRLASDGLLFIVHSRLSRFVVSEHMKRCQDKTIEKINWLMDIERRAFTLNTHYYGDYKDKFLSFYRGCHQNGEDVLLTRLQLYSPAKSPSEMQNGVSQVLSVLPQIGITGAKPIDLAKLLPPDPREPTINIMAGVRAYFQGSCPVSVEANFNVFTCKHPVAYKRFTDLVPLAIDHEFVLGAARGIEAALYTGLKIDGTNGQQLCRDLIQEPTHISTRRDVLQKQRDRLMTAQEELLRVGV